MLCAAVLVLLAVATSGAMGPGLSNRMLALTIGFIPQMARVAERVTTQVAKLGCLLLAESLSASLAAVPCAAACCAF